VEACMILADIYGKGLDVRKNASRARRYLSEACDRKHRPACDRLGK
ncbi:MAG: SEL1-like repeat protein, partial [Duodenibacillus sp.]|nr:SEL1-like repeat protein [Duodenibacillus sp.]